MLPSAKRNDSWKYIFLWADVKPKQLLHNNNNYCYIQYSSENLCVEASVRTEIHGEKELLNSSGVIGVDTFK